MVTLKHPARMPSLESSYQIMREYEIWSIRVGIILQKWFGCDHDLHQTNAQTLSSSLKTRHLHFREDASDWTAVMAESLSATPLLLNDGTFDGNFGDLVNWVASFLVQFSPSRGERSSIWEECSTMWSLMMTKMIIWDLRCSKIWF